MCIWIFYFESTEFNAIYGLIISTEIWKEVKIASIVNLLMKLILISSASFASSAKWILVPDRPLVILFILWEADCFNSALEIV